MDSGMTRPRISVCPVQRRSAALGTFETWQRAQETWTRRVLDARTKLPPTACIQGLETRLTTVRGHVRTDSMRKLHHRHAFPVKPLFVRLDSTEMGVLVTLSQMRFVLRAAQDRAILPWVLRARLEWTRALLPATLVSTVMAWSVFHAAPILVLMARFALAIRPSVRPTWLERATS